MLVWETKLHQNEIINLTDVYNVAMVEFSGKEEYCIC